MNKLIRSGVGLLLLAALIFTAGEHLLMIAVALASILIGAFLFLFALPLVPHLVELLANDPNKDRGNSQIADYRVSSFGFFTSIAPGQVKIVETGDHFVRGIMAFEDHAFKGHLDRTIDPRTSEYWEVIKTERVQPDTHPIPLIITLNPLVWLFWLWQRWVFFTTGYVFTGIYPWRKVRTYKLDRQKKLHGNDDITDKEDYSDHFRVADFVFPLVVEEADTLDKVPVRVRLDLVLRVYNPYLAAYGTDDWASRVGSTAKDVVTSYTRPRPLDHVLSAKQSANPDDEANELARAVWKIGKRENGKNAISGQQGSIQEDSILSIGIEVTQVMVLDISPVEPSTEIGKQLAKEAIARVEARAKETLAKGDAAQLREQITAVKEGEHYGLAVLASERNVRTAAAAGDRGIVVVNGGGDVDPIQAAMLHELKNISKAKGGTKE